MHIPENYLSPATCGVMTAAMVPVIINCARNVKKEIPKERLSLLGIFSAFSFVAMMFNIPLPAGSTGHAVGGTLIAILLGPEAACLSISVTLIIQALLFGDGGILAIGANCFNMAFALPFAGYGVYTLVSRLIKGSKGQLIAAGIGAYAGINVAALLTALELGVQPYLFKDASGQAMYCPYGLDKSVPAMMLGHITIFGIAEVIFTASVLAFIRVTAPEIIRSKSPNKKGKALTAILLGVLVCLTPIGLIAGGTAWGEWSTEELSALNGFTPSGMEHGVLSGFEALCPDYSIGTLPEVVSYALSAMLGVSIVVIIFKLAAAFRRDKVNYDEK